MELEVEPPETSLIQSAKRLALSLGDFAPLLGPVKMAVEATRGQTVDGFTLNTFERACYGTAVASNVWSFYLLYDLVVNRNFVTVGALAPICQSTYYASMFAGKLRNTGSIFAQNTFLKRAAVEVKGIASDLYYEE